MGKLIEFNGKMLTQSAIAKQLGISRQAVHSRIKYNGGPYLQSHNSVVAAPKKSQVQHGKHVQYNGEQLTVPQIALLEGRTTQAIYGRMSRHGMAERLCVRCKQPGHRAKQCSLAPKPRKPCTCSGCGEVGHNMATCGIRSVLKTQNV